MCVKLRKSNISTDGKKLQDVEQWLAGILVQMLIDKCCEHLPYEAIADILKPDKKGVVRELTVQSLENYLTEYTSYTDGFKLTDAKPPKMTDEKLRELAEDRYAPILKKWIHTQDQEVGNE